MRVCFVFPLDKFGVILHDFVLVYSFYDMVHVITIKCWIEGMSLVEMSKIIILTNMSFFKRQYMH